MANLRVIVIGGGAAGFFGAITCATARPQTQVTLIEAGRQPLAKVRISGGGRCNVTHHCFQPAELIQSYPRGGKALRSAFTRFQPRDTVAWFEQRGVKLKTEADGRMFPVTDSSTTIVNCLQWAAQSAGVELLTGTPVISVRSLLDSDLSPLAPLNQGGERGGFEVVLKTGAILKCDRLLIATGSNRLGYSWAKDLGHAIAPPVPSLFTFKIKDPRLEGLAGVTVANVRLRLLETGKQKLEQTGDLLVTHWGLSGPVVLKLSAWGARVLHERRYDMSLAINWLSEYNRESLRQYLLEVKGKIPKKKISTSGPFSLAKRLWQRLVHAAGINEVKSWADLSKQELNRLVLELIESVYHIQGKGVFKEEFVTCGGVSLKEVNFKTMESKKCSGLYFAGEILDIDGVTGGFNFQSAWTTAWLAGQAIVK